MQRSETAQLNHFQSHHQQQSQQVCSSPQPSLSTKKNNNNKSSLSNTATTNSSTSFVCSDFLEAATNLEGGGSNGGLSAVAASVFDNNNNNNNNDDDNDNSNNVAWTPTPPLATRATTTTATISTAKTTNSSSEPLSYTVPAASAPSLLSAAANTPPLRPKVGRRAGDRQVDESTNTPQPQPNNKPNSSASLVAAGSENSAADLATTFGRELKNYNTQTLILSIVVAILIVLLIISVGVALWALIEPYSVPLVGAAVLSVALHEPNDAVRDHSKRFPVSRSIIAAKSDFRLNWPTLGKYFSPLVAIPVYFYHLLQTALIKFGVGKYPLINKINSHVQNVAFFVMLAFVTARLASFLFPKLLVGALISSAVLGGVPLVFAFVFCWFLPERKFVQTIRAVTSGLTVLVISLLFSTSIVLEIHQGGKDTVATIQSFGINIPDNAAEVASSYILSSNTTEVLLPALKQLSFNGSWDQIYNNTMEFAHNHTTTLSNAFAESQTAAKGVAGIVTNIVTFVLTLLFWSFSKLYEIFLFLMTLSVLLSLDRTILYYCLKKVLTVVFGNEMKAKAKAEKTEKRMIGELSTLFYSLWHVFVFHFVSTLVWYSAFDMPFSVTVSTIGGLVALFPLSLPPMVTQIIVACIVMAIRRNFQWEMLLTGFAFWYASMCVDLIIVSEQEHPLQKQLTNSSSTSTSTTTTSSSSTAKISGNAVKTETNDGNNNNNNNNHRSSKVQASPSSPLDQSIAKAQSNIAQKQLRVEKASGYLVTTSIVLGLQTFGVAGVVIGPIVFIVAHALWDAF